MTKSWGLYFFCSIALLFVKIYQIGEGQPENLYLERENNG